MNQEIPEMIFNLKDHDDFIESSLKIFDYQSDRSPVYNKFIKVLGRDREKVKCIEDIPFLPVEFFRNQRIITEELDPVVIFESSGTTGSLPGRHYVYDLNIYESSFLKSFRLFYGEPSGYIILALLPSYSGRKNSSLIYMMNSLIKGNGHPQSGFYGNNFPELIRVIRDAKSNQQKVLLLGVSFALLDLAEQYSPDLSGIIVMETGGMKGQRKELTREELHRILKMKFNLPVVHSEYGMTELLSQAYSKGNGIFYSPPWMKVLIRDPHDPLSIFSEPGKTGGINIIDLANIYSCSFLATGDLGKLHEDGSFEVLGRFDNSDIRGCNLMAD